MHELSCDDVLGHNEDLIACAIEQLDSEECKPLVLATCETRTSSRFTPATSIA